MPAKTEAQKRAQSNYMDKFKRFSVRLLPEDHQAMKDHAAARGESTNDFVTRAIRETMERDKGKGDVVNPD